MATKVTPFDDLIWHMMISTLICKVKLDCVNMC